jgi:hypothetical protein
LKARTAAIILKLAVGASLFGLLVYVSNGDSYWTWNGYRHAPVSVWPLLFIAPLVVGFAFAIASYSRSLRLKNIRSGRMMP